MREGNYQTTQSRQCKGHSGGGAGAGALDYSVTAGPRVAPLHPMRSPISPKHPYTKTISSSQNCVYVGCAQTLVTREWSPTFQPITDVAWCTRYTTHEQGSTPRGSGKCERTAVSFPRVSSMVGNPPPIAPAVLLLKRPRKGGPQDVFLAGFAKSSTAASTSTTDVIMTAEEATPKRAGCSGDPANCTACAFGKAFTKVETHAQW